MTDEDNSRTEAEPVENAEIQEDFEIEQPEPEPHEPRDAREEIYQNFSRKRDDEIAAEAESVENTDSADIIDGDDDQPTPPDGDEMVEVIVYGEVHRVSADKVFKAGGLQAYQKHLAVEKGLQVNAHRAKELDAREEALRAREASASNPPDVPATDRHDGQTPDRSTPTGDQNLEELAGQAVEALYDGGENASSSLANLVEKAVQAKIGTGEPFDEGKLREQVKEDILRDQRQSQVDKARAKFIGDHPELNSRDAKFDPRMFEAVDIETEVVARENPEWEPEQVMSEAYDRIQRWRGLKKSDSMQDKQRDKQAMTRPKAGSQRYTPPPPPPRQTDSDYVSNLRKQRGLE